MMCFLRAKARVELMVKAYVCIDHMSMEILK